MITKQKKFTKKKTICFIFILLRVFCFQLTVHIGNKSYWQSGMSWSRVDGGLRVPEVTLHRTRGHSEQLRPHKHPQKPCLEYNERECERRQGLPTRSGQDTSCKWQMKSRTYPWTGKWSQNARLDSFPWLWWSPARACPAAGVGPAARAQRCSCNPHRPKIGCRRLRPLRRSAPRQHPQLK